MDASTVAVSIVSLHQLKPAWLLLMLVHSWFNLWNTQKKENKMSKCYDKM